MSDARTAWERRLLKMLSVGLITQNEFSFLRREQEGLGPIAIAPGGGENGVEDVKPGGNGPCQQP